MKTKFVFKFTAMLAMGLFVIVSCEGPMGPQGPPGEQGPPGPVGPAGSDGSIIHAGQGTPEGNMGNPGDFYLDLTTGNLFGPKMAEGWGAPFSLVGAEGPEGPRGPAGPLGPQGPAGEDGQDGERGPQGPAGEDGQDGQDGEQGPQGPSGEDGQDGEDGEQGPQGPQGPEGPQGPAGEDGQDGEDGKDGKDGSQIYAGNGAPDSSQGTEGDYYLDKTNYELYGPKTGSGWGTPINLQGPQGPQGEQGPEGPQGSPAFLDIQNVEGSAVVTTEDERSRVSLVVDCPAGYNVLGGGAVFSFSTGDDRWFMISSSPRLAEDFPSIDFDGWTAAFETVDGENAEGGNYGFSVKAICAKMD